MKYKYLIAATVIFVSAISHAADSKIDKKLDELLTLMDVDSMVDTMHLQMEGMLQNMSVQMGVQPSEQSIFDEYKAKVTSLVKEDMSWEQMEPLVLDIYQRNFTEAEIDDMLVFYRSETGKSLINKMPVVMQESMQVSQTFLQQSLPKIQELSQQLAQEIEQSRVKE